MRIYFLHNGMRSFVKRDLEILRSAHEVREESNHGRALRNLPRNLGGILWSECLYCWFGSVHFLPSVLMAKLLGRKIVVVAGGYDVASVPSLEYGGMRSWPRSALGRFLFRLADRVVAVSASNLSETLRNARVDPAKVSLVHHGFAPSPAAPTPKERTVVSVGDVSDANLLRKGLEDFVRAAAAFPDVRFMLVGRWVDGSHLRMEEIATPNVEITGLVDDASLSGVLSGAKVYVQASRHEAFGCAVAEAMLYRCIPVVSNVSALPEVVGDCGFLVTPGKREELEARIADALDADEAEGERCRVRILETFPLEKRREALLGVVAGA